MNKKKPDKKTTKKTTKRTTKVTKKKAFTLIELLAVIIILGVLLLVAIPSVTSYIADSRKKVYIDTAKNYISGARVMVNKGDSDVFDPEVTYYIPIECISIETGGESPYGKFKGAYVLVSYNEKGFDYYWASTDTAKMGIIQTNEYDLNEELIKPNVDSIDTTISVAPNSKVSVMDPNT